MTYLFSYSVFAGGPGGMVKGCGHIQQRAAGELRQHLEPARPILQCLLQGKVQARVVDPCQEHVLQIFGYEMLKNQN